MPMTKSKTISFRINLNQNYRISMVHDLLLCHLSRFHVPCSVLTFYVFSTIRCHVESRDGCAACVESFRPNNFCPPREVDRRASVLALRG